MMTRNISFAQAIKEGTTQLMERLEEVYLIGEGVDDFKGVWGTTEGMAEKFGRERVTDIPLSENGMTGIAVGTALMGFRPVFIHQRIDFMLMCMDALFNHAAKWHYMTGLQKKVPLTVRAVIGRGWGQSVQHAQSFYPVFAHFPGVKVVAPYTPYDAKGALIASVLDEDPVIIIESRNLYDDAGYVPDTFYSIPLGKASILKEGTDITVVSLSYGLRDVLAAAEELEAEGISAEVIDLKSIKPLDMETIIQSVEKTKNIVIVDITWEYFNIASEISCRVVDSLFNLLQRPPLRITLPDSYVGAGENMEKQYYNDSLKISDMITGWMQK